VIRLAERLGIAIGASLSKADKLIVVQELAEKGDKDALTVFESIGAVLAHTLPLYAGYYDMRHVLLLGRVMSGAGGDALYAAALRVLNDEYPELTAGVSLHLPDEKIRRVGQSVAAASLPKIV
jgi:hypothetical protein